MMIMINNALNMSSNLLALRTIFFMCYVMRFKHILFGYKVDRKGLDAAVSATLPSPNVFVSGEVVNPTNTR